MAKLIFPPTNYYNKAVMDDTGCSVEDSHLVVQVMRDQHGTLDSLRAPEFKRDAKAAYKALGDAKFRKLIESNFVRR
jgi:hypothetical protein